MENLTSVLGGVFIQKSKIMASSPIMANRWGNSRNSGRLYFGGSKFTGYRDCSHEIKRRLLLGRKVMTSLDSIFKSRDITLPIKVCLVKAMFFSSSHVWMWELDHKESWLLKNWCFCIVVLEKTLESPWTARRSSQSILKARMPKLKPQYFNHLMQGTDSLGKPLMLEKIEGGRKRGRQRMKW